MADRVAAFMERLRTTLKGGSLDWNALRAEIVDEHKNATTEAQREALLDLYCVLMERVGQSVEAADQTAFNKTRQQEYNLMLISEAAVADDIDPDKLHEVTQREIAAGRMAPDNDLADLAKAGALFLGANKIDLPPPVAVPAWRRFLRWLSG